MTKSAPSFDINSLNPEQAAAVQKIHGPMLILAGAGTGKTRVITCRIAHMIQQGISPESIVALSFTNKAAKEMGERTRGMVGAAAKDVGLSTFHSFCLRILREHHKHLDLPARFGLAGTADQIDLVRRGLTERKIQNAYDPAVFHGRIGQAKNDLLGPDEIRAGGSTRTASDESDYELFAEVYELYERQLKLNRLIDFDDCIFKTVRLLRSHPEVKAKLRERFRYFMVDEFQDTNMAQLAVLTELVGDGHNVCVVGDDDQSIYSWRGAVYEILERFEEAFPGTQLVKLEQNYRCSTKILDAANQVIKNNAMRKDKTLWCKNDNENLPLILESKDDEAAEASFVAEKIIGHLGRGGSPADVGILYRANAQAKALELALREARIPYKTFGGQSFFERKEVKDFMAYLRLILNDGDRLALWRIINVPARGIGMKTLERIEAEAKARRKSPFTLIGNPTFLETLSPKNRRSVEDFHALIARLQALPLNSPEDMHAFGKAIVNDSGLLNDQMKIDKVAARERRLENLRGLPDWLQSVGEDLQEEHGHIDIDALLDVMSLDQDNKVDQRKGPEEFVSLMTIHAAKGLEFPTVFLCGIEEEQLPHKNSIGDNRAIAEERRLFYVAITRAKEQLYMSYAKERKGGFQNHRRLPSRFLREIPPEHIGDALEGAKTVEERAQQRKNKTVNLLGSLRQNLRQPRKS